MDKSETTKNFEMWLENEEQEAFPVFISIDEKVLKKWLNDNCYFDGKVYRLIEKEFPLANAPYDDKGYIVKYEDEIKGFVRARRMISGKMPESSNIDIAEDEEMHMGGM